MKGLFRFCRMKTYVFVFYFDQKIFSLIFLNVALTANHSLDPPIEHTHLLRHCRCTGYHNMVKAVQNAAIKHEFPAT